jgi:K319-like protein
MIIRRDFAVVRLCVASALVASVFIVGTWAATGDVVVDQEFLAPSPENGLEVTANQSVAQTFTVGVTGLLSRVDVAQFVHHQGIATGDVIIEVRSTDPEGRPSNADGSILGAVRLHPADIPTSFNTPITIDLGRFGIQVTEGIVLALVARRPDDAPEGRYGWWGMYDHPCCSLVDPYPGGHSYSYSVGYSFPWNLWAVDLGFRTVVTLDAHPPHAEGGDDIEVLVGRVTTLDGSASSDADGDDLSHAWSVLAVPAGSAAELSDVTSPTPSFIPDLPGEYRFGLTVSDGVLASSLDTVSITAVTLDTYVTERTAAVASIVRTLSPAEVSARGSQVALLRFLGLADDALAAGDLAEARFKLEQALVHADGCVLRGAPDRSGPERDWVLDCVAQSRIFGRLASAIDALTP